jgi:hypothetical protein
MLDLLEDSYLGVRMMASRRDDFTLDTKERLAARAGYRCSFPGCPALTIGPSSEGPDATSSVGMACHISSASAGLQARRYRPDMSSEDRRSISNGIWMCFTHGKLIDTDETRFTIPQLEKWREIAELRARYEVERAAGRPPRLFDLDLAPGNFRVRTSGTEGKILGEALQDAGVGEIWGLEEMHAVRDCVVEFVQNALTHGRAPAVNVSIEGRCIRVTDDGALFDPWSLYGRDSESGGVLAVTHLLDVYRENIVLSSSGLGDRNQVIISLARSAEDVRNATPCCLEFGWGDKTVPAHAAAAQRPPAREAEGAEAGSRDPPPRRFGMLKVVTCRRGSTIKRLRKRPSHSRVWACYLLNKTVMSPEPLLAVTMSALPSPFTSPIATLGFLPALYGEPAAGV